MRTNRVRIDDTEPCIERPRTNTPGFAMVADFPVTMVRETTNNFQRARNKEQRHRIVSTTPRRARTSHRLLSFPLFSSGRTRESIERKRATFPSRVTFHSRENRNAKVVLSSTKIIFFSRCSIYADHFSPARYGDDAPRSRRPSRNEKTSDATDRKYEAAQ